MVLVLGTLGLVVVFALVISGCASLGFTEHLGTLTITGIPAEYEGGYIDIPFAAGGETILNGTVNIEAISVADDAGAANFGYNISKAGAPTIGIFFESVRINNKAAAVNFDDGVKTGLLTITGIPDEYNLDKEKSAGYVTFLMGKNLRKGGALALLGGWTGSDASNQGTVVDGGISVPAWSFVADGLPRPYAENTATKVLITIQVGSGTFESFLFEPVELTDGNATVNFSQGKRQ
jgi:hypothetical protein